MASADKETTGSASSGSEEIHRAEAGSAFDEKLSSSVDDGKKGSVRKRGNNNAKSSRTRDKPRRPLSSYNYFFKEESARISSEVNINPALQHLKGNPNELFKAVGRLVASRWKLIADEQKKKYLEMANEDMKRYEQEKNEYFRRRARTAIETGVGGPGDALFPTMGGSMYSTAMPNDTEGNAISFRRGIDVLGVPLWRSDAGSLVRSPSTVVSAMTHLEDICRTISIQAANPSAQLHHNLTSQEQVDVSEHRTRNNTPGSFFQPAIELQLWQLQQQNDRILHRRTFLLEAVQAEEQRRREAALLLRLRLVQLGQVGLGLLSGLPLAPHDFSAPLFGSPPARSAVSSEDMTNLRDLVSREALGAFGDGRHGAQSFLSEQVEATSTHGTEQRGLHRGNDYGNDDGTDI